MKILKNYLYNVSYQLLAIVLPLITVPYISKVLGAEGVGIYSLTFANTQYFIIFGMIGLSLYGNRQIAYVRNNRRKLKETFFSIYTLQLITTGTSLLIFFIYTYFFNSGDYRTLYLIQSVNIIAAMVDVSWLFMGLEEFKKTVIRNTLVKLVSLASIFIFVKDKNDLVMYAAIISGSTLLGNLSLWFYVPEKVGKKYIRPKNIKKHVRASMALFIPQISIQIYCLLDKTLLGMMTNTVEVGYYENTQKLYKVAITVATSIGTVMMPRIANIVAEGNMKKVKFYIKKSFFFVTLISVPLMFGLMAISKELCPWFFTSEFNGIENLVVVYSVVIFLVSWSNVLGTQLLVPMNRTKEFTISVTCGAIVNLVLNLLVLKQFKALGACYTTVAAEITVTAVQFWFVRKFISLRELVKPTLLFIPAGICMYIAVRFIGSAMGAGIVTNIVQVIVGAVVYLGLVLIFYIPKNKQTVINYSKSRGKRNN